MNIDFRSYIASREKLMTYIADNKDTNLVSLGKIIQYQLNFIYSNEIRYHEF